MTTEHRPRRGRPRDPDAEPRIREVTIKLLLERGFDGTTVDDVAEAAGVGKATIYRRWPSKEQLAYDAMITLFDLELPDPDTGSIESDLRSLYDAAVALVNTEEGRALIRLSISEALRDPQTAALYRDFIDRRVVRTKTLVDRARRRGEAIHPDVDVRVMVHWLAGMLILRTVTGEPMPRSDEVDRLVRMTMRGIS
jgi:AcrR family transcriptional regulator